MLVKGACPIPDISIGLDIADIAGATNQLNQILRSSSSALDDFTIKTIKFNESGKATSAVVEQIDQAGRKVATAFDIAGTSVQKTGQIISQSTAAAKKAIDDLAKSMQQVNSIDAAKNIAAAFPAPSSATTAGLTQYSAAISNLQRAYISSGAGAQQFNSMLQSAQINAKAFAASIISMPANMQTLARAILGVAGAAQLAGQAGNQFGITWQGLVRLIEVQVIRRAITATINALRDGIKTAIEYQVQVQQAANLAGQTSGAQRGAFQTNVRQFSEQGAVPLGQTAQALSTATTQQGGNAAAGVNSLNQAMKLSQATGLGLNNSMNLLTTTLETFRLSSTDAARAANVLYLAAQDSRRPVDQLSNAMGRIGPVAHNFGISMEEILAAYATIASQGGRPSESINRLNQVLGKFAAPTPAIKDFLRSIGEESARSAIMARGLTGFLQLLADAVEKAPEKLNEFGGSLRTDAAFMALLGDNTVKFNEQLQRYRSPTNSSALNQGATAVTEQTGFKLQQFNEQIKNIFSQDISTPFINGLGRITESIGGARGAFTAFKDAIYVVITAFVAYKLAVIAGSIAQGGATASLRSFTTALGSVSSLQAWTVALGAAAVAYTVLKGAVDAYAAAQVAATQKEIAAMQAQNVKDQAQITANGQQRITTSNAQIQQQFTSIRALSQQNLMEANDLRDVVLAGHRDIAQSWSRTSQSFLDTLRSSLSATRSAINQNNAALNNIDTQLFQNKLHNVTLQYRTMSHEAQTFYSINAQGQAGALQSYGGGLGGADVNAASAGARMQIITERMEQIQKILQRPPQGAGGLYTPEQLAADRGALTGI